MEASQSQEIKIVHRAKTNNEASLDLHIFRFWRTTIATFIGRKRFEIEIEFLKEAHHNAANFELCYWKVKTQVRNAYDEESVQIFIWQFFEWHIGRVDILFPSNHNIHKSSYGLCFWASDPLIGRLC